MTDARLHPSMLSNRKVARLSDSAFRVYVMSLVWCAAHESDGVMPRREAFALHPTADPPQIVMLVDELLKQRVWEAAPTEQGDQPSIRVHDFLTYNTSVESLESRRLAKSAAEKERRKRERDKCASTNTVDSHVDARVDNGERKAGRQDLKVNPAPKEPTPTEPDTHAHGTAPLAVAR